jgi:hypothetical protein
MYIKSVAVAESARKELLSIAKEQVLSIRNGIQVENLVKRDDILSYIDSHLAKTLSLIQDLEKKELVKNEIYNLIAEDRRKQLRLAKGQAAIKRIRTEVPIIVTEVNKYNTLIPQVDITHDIQGVLKKRLDGLYNDESLQGEIEALTSEIRSAVIKQTPSIDLIYSDADVAKRVDEEYQLYKARGTKRSFKNLFATVGLFSTGLATLTNGIFNLFLTGQANADAIWLKISASGLGLVLTFLGTWFGVKVINAIRDGVLKNENYKESSEEMMKDFTNESNFKKMLFYLDEDRYASAERYHYKKELLVTINRSLGKYRLIQHNLEILLKRLIKSRKKSDEAVKLLVLREANRYFQKEKRKDINEITNSGASGDLLRSSLFTLVRNYLAQNKENIEHILDLKRIFLPHLRIDKIEFRLFKRIEYIFDKKGQEELKEIAAKKKAAAPRP